MFEVEPSPLETTISAASTEAGRRRVDPPPDPSGEDAPSVMRFVCSISEWYSGSPCSFHLATTALISSSDT